MSLSVLVLLGDAILLHKRHKSQRGLAVERNVKYLAPSLNQEDTINEEAEQKELDIGTLDALKGEEASLRDDPDTAQHEFSIGAGRLEAASNDASAEKNDANAEKREKDEHELAERLEHLADENRKLSAEKASNKPPSTDEGDEDDKKDESDTHKSSSDELEDQPKEEEQEEQNVEKSETEDSEGESSESNNSEAESSESKNSEAESSKPRKVTKSKKKYNSKENPSSEDK